MVKHLLKLFILVCWVATGSTSAWGQVITESFDNCSAGLPGNWMQYSVKGAQVWRCTTFGQTGNGVQMNGYTSTSNENEDWLISPEMDVSAFAIPLMAVNYRTKFAGNGLVIKASTNYSGSSNPTAATWTDIATLPANNTDAWEKLENISLEAYKSANTHIAFVYTSTNLASARWTLDNVEVKSVANYIATSNLDLYFSETGVGSESAPQEFTFRASDFTENITVSVPANFEVSKDGIVYTVSVSYTAAEAATLNTVYIRMKPATAAVNSGPITFTSGDFIVTRGKLSGSSILKVNTLDVATWNMDWFGSTSNGPSNENLQYENAKKVITELNADIIGLQEIVDEAKVQALAQELGYNYISETMSWQSSSSQKVAFLYKPEVVAVKKEKVLLSKLYSDIRTGNTTLPGYPDGRSSFLWSSGRLPYMVQFEATINGVKQTYAVVNIHAKANDDTPLDDYERRKYDAQVLRDSLAAQYANENLIILGDYNDDVDVSVVNNMSSSFEVFVADNNFITLTYDLSTTGAVTYESGSLKSFLDHLIISKSLEEEYVDNSIHIEAQLLEMIANYRSTTSDHLPVSARFYLNADNTTGIADATKGQFKVYPNPVTNYVNLLLPEKAAMGDVNLSVWTVDGKKVLETTNSLGATSQSLNSKIGNLAKGIYIIKVQAGNQFYQTKLLKK